MISCCKGTSWPGDRRQTWDLEFSVLSLAVYQMSPCFLMATLPEVRLDLWTLVPFSYHQDEPQWEQMQLANRNDQLILYGQKSILTNDHLLDQNRCRFIGFINGILSISHFLYYWEWIEVTLNWLKQWICEHGELMVTPALQIANNTEEQLQESITDCRGGEGHFSTHFQAYKVKGYFAS